MKIRKAQFEDHTLLTELTVRSKSFWDYSEAQIEKWLPELTISAEYILKHEVFVLVENEKIIAYYSYYAESENQVLLDNLFVNPDFIGKGIGKLMLKDFLMRTKNDGFKSVLLYSDPNSEGFYHSFDFEVIGQEPTSIEGRFLPIMTLKF